MVNITAESLRSGEHVELGRYFFSESIMQLVLRARDGRFLICFARFDENDQMEVVRANFVTPRNFSRFREMWLNAFDAYEGYSDE